MSSGFLRGPVTGPAPSLMKTLASIAPSNPAARGLSEHKKGEINEMRDALIKAINSRKEDEKTEVLRKIIQNMTLGMDLTDLFHHITMASHTKDLIQKKMIYLFLNNYSKENEEMAMMAVNSMLRDTNDDSPMIRGLALRWLCSLGTPTLVEHMVEPLKKGLVDINPYVRRCATMSCAKVFRLSPNPFADGAIVNKLYSCIRDKDAHVVINSLLSLEEILAESGGVAINQKIVLHLMTHLREFNEWGQTVILKLLLKYNPENDEELFAMMNLLDSRFQHPNSALVLSTVHLFLTYTQTRPEIHHHVFLRIKAPLMGLLLRSANEIQYSTLSHIILLSRRSPGLFANEFKYFYVKITDPDFVKLQKVKVLQQIASMSNFKDILTEISCYVTDHDEVFAKEAIRIIGEIAIRFPPASAQALEILLGNLEIEQMPHVLETTLRVMKDMLRRYPTQAPDVIPRLSTTLDIVKDTDAISAAVAMIGSYGEILEDAPYLIEEMVQDWDSHKAKVKNQLILSSLKLFFKKPNEMKNVLGQVFSKAVEDFTNPDVHDKAIFYYRLLSTSPDMCKITIESTKNVEYVQEDDAAEVDRLFEQFNSLSVVFKQTAERFIVTNTQ